MCTASTDAAYALSRLWKQSAHAKLLKQPPAESHSSRHAALFSSSIQYAEDLKQQTFNAFKLWQEDRTLNGQAFVDSMLAARPVAVLCRLLVWLQQRPELLQLPALAADEHAFVGQASHGALWLASLSGWLADTSAAYQTHGTEQLPLQQVHAVACSSVLASGLLPLQPATCYIVLSLV
jgi:hypothetical protein